MPIRRLLENHVFGPDEITVLTTAFEDTLRALRLADRADPVTEIIARKIIELAEQGERGTAAARGFQRLCRRGAKNPFVLERSARPPSKAMR